MDVCLQLFKQAMPASWRRVGPFPDAPGLRCENSPEPEPTRTRTHQNSEFQNSPAFWLRSGPLRSAAFWVLLRSARTHPAFWLRSGPLRSAAFWVLLRSGRTQNPAFCVLDPCVLLRSGILRSAAFWVLLRSRSAAFCVLLRSRSAAFASHWLYSQWLHPEFVNHLRWHLVQIN